ncbi:MAG TPA: HAMP domain-containing sensor histidine kinase [Flavobacterium sp.]|nr:HAMP domain-containing sensor histidine kinase [Flavobacterium sp.]
MKIRNKILIYFSSTVIVLSALSLVLVFILFSAHREEEFQQQQFSKIKYTVGLIDEFEQMSAEVSRLLDKQDIHDFYDEKMLIYDNHKNLVFSSIDSLDIINAKAMLLNLSVANHWIETKEHQYDLIGVYIEHNAKGYYAISKAYDYFGYSKKDFLQKVLIGIFAATVVIVLLVSFYLSNIISKPISELSQKIGEYDVDKNKNSLLEIETTTSELKDLSEKFNQLTQRINDAFVFQKHSIQHISHELKTPIAILVSELEKLQNQTDMILLKSDAAKQTQKAKTLGNIINVLLQISKIEAGQDIPKKDIRVDDVIFNCISEINSIYPNFNFEVNFSPHTFDEKKLLIKANEPLIKHAFMNLLHNCVHYSEDKKAKIKFDLSSGVLAILIANSGQTLLEEEQKYLFSHFFRGENSQDKPGSGLGLVLTQKIFAIHQASISYRPGSDNVFEVKFKYALDS